MRWLRAAVLTFSTYTRIPMPQVKWDDAAMKLSIAFLPLVGVLLSLAAWCWLLICGAAEIGSVLFGAFMTALPVLITGGIHMDGYCDTSDALASWQSKERRLEILKDPRVGAFALIRFAVYILFEFALFTELYGRGLALGVVFIFPLSRCLAAWSALTMKNARKDGMLAAFTEKAEHRAVTLILTLLTVLALACWTWFTLPHGLAGIVLCVPVTLWYRRMAKNKFGGVTGDTTGFYLQITELTLTAGILIGSIVDKWL